MTTSPISLDSIKNQSSSCATLSGKIQELAKKIEQIGQQTGLTESVQEEVIKASEVPAETLEELKKEASSLQEPVALCLDTANKMLGDATQHYKKKKEVSELRKKIEELEICQGELEKLLPPSPPVKKRKREPSEVKKQDQEVETPKVPPESEKKALERKRAAPKGESLRPEKKPKLGPEKSEVSPLTLIKNFTKRYEALVKDNKLDSAEAEALFSDMMKFDIWGYPFKEDRNNPDYSEAVDLINKSKWIKIFTHQLAIRQLFSRVDEFKGAFSKLIFTFTEDAASEFVSKANDLEENVKLYLDPKKESAEVCNQLESSLKLVTDYRERIIKMGANYREQIMKKMVMLEPPSTELEKKVAQLRGKGLSEEQAGQWAPAVVVGEMQTQAAAQASAAAGIQRETKTSQEQQGEAIPKQQGAAEQLQTIVKIGYAANALENLGGGALTALSKVGVETPVAVGWAASLGWHGLSKIATSSAPGAILGYRSYTNWDRMQKWVGVAVGFPTVVGLVARGVPPWTALKGASTVALIAGEASKMSAVREVASKIKIGAQRFLHLT